MRTFTANAVLPPGIQPAVNELSAGKISEVWLANEAMTAKDSADLAIETCYLAPGLIDLQIKGASGTDLNSTTSAVNG
jgi:N-acetylglucosamine-6-phosphate deacetylase